MPEFRAATTTADDRLAAPRGGWVAPWRVGLWLLCIGLALAAGWLTWTEQRAAEAQALDAELMLRVAQRWADAQALAGAGGDEAPSPGAGLPSALAAAADSQRVLALVDRQHQLEPSRTPAVGGAREAWAAAASTWAARLREGPEAAPRQRLRDAARGMAQASQRLLQVLRERAEARGAPSGGGARPGVLLALASLGLLVLGLRRSSGAAAVMPPSAAGSDGDHDMPASARAAVVASAGLPRQADAASRGAGDAALGMLVDEAKLRATIDAGGAATGASALLVLLADAPAALLAEIGAEARLTLERQIVRRLHEHLGAGDPVAPGDPGAERIELLVLLAAPRAGDTAWLQTLVDDLADAYTVCDHPVRPPMRFGRRALAATAGQGRQALHDARLAALHAAPGALLDYSDELGAQAAAREAAAAAIDAALASGELMPQYHAVFAASAPRAGCGETLLGWRAGWCWRHPQQGALDHAAVMQLAAGAGRAEALLGRLQQEALAAFARWRAAAALPDEVRIGVPWLLPAAPGDDDAVAAVQRLLAAAALPATRLELLVDDAADGSLRAADVAALRRLGVQITLQGLDHQAATLSALPQLGASGVLIARRFVDQLPGNHAHRVLVQAIVSLAAQHGLATSAEGVDSPHQRAELAALGVGAVQGGAALAASDAAGVAAWLAAARPAS